MPRPIPTREHAAGMLAALTATHTCGEACTATVMLGDGTIVTLRCPWKNLSLDSAADRLIIQTCYADVARAALSVL